MRCLVVFSLALAACSVLTFPRQSNDRPIIGILTQPLPLSRYPALPHPPSNNSDPSYIAASYVKFVESAGGRAVPLMHTLNQTRLAGLLSSLNGVLFPGGDSDLSRSTPLYRAAKTVYDHAVSVNQGGGDTFVLWGTCQGFQLIAEIGAQPSDHILCLDCFDSLNMTLPLMFTPEALSSNMYGSMDRELMIETSEQPLTTNAHVSGIAPKGFLDSPLSPSFRILSTNSDRKGYEFVSSFEHVTMPIFAVQYHPEKANFEWVAPRLVNHSASAVRLSQHLANVMVDYARGSLAKFPSRVAEEMLLMRNFDPIPDPVGVFDQIYVFP